MDPYDEQSLREEVLYLHSLWHQGPPRQQRPPLHLHPPSSSLHHLSNHSQINKKRSKKSTGKEYQNKLKNLRQSEQQPVKEWPVNPTSISSPASTSGWPTPLSISDSKTLLPSPEEQARLAASRAQVKALNATIDLLSSDDIDEDDLEDIDDDDDDDSMEKISGFFVNLFMEYGELKEYYLKNYWNGEFNCLVCGWTLKKYKDCAALVQHSNSIAKKRRVHRAYGRAVCNLLGWEIDKLPQIISDLSVKVNESLNKSSVCTSEAQETIACETKESSSILVNDEQQKNELADSGNMPNNGDSVISEETIACETKESLSILVNDEQQKNELADSGNMPYNGDSVISEEPKVEASACEGEAKNDGPADA